MCKSSNLCKKNTENTQSTNLNVLKFIESLCKNPEAFAQGLGKNASGQKHGKRKHKKQYSEKINKFNHTKRCDKYFTQGGSASNIFSLFHKLTLPGQFQEDVKDMVMPFSEMSQIMNGPEFQIALNNFNRVATHGIKVDHSLGINDELVLIFFIVTLVGAHYSKNNTLKVISSLGSLVFTLKLIKPGAVSNIFQYVLGKIKDACTKSCKIPINSYNDIPDLEDPCFYDCEEDIIVTQSIDFNLMYRMVVLVVSSFAIVKNYGDITINSISKIDKFAKTLTPITSLFKSGSDILTTIITFIETVVNAVGKWFNDDFRFAFGGEVWYELEILRKRLTELRQAFDERGDLGEVARKARALKADLQSVAVPKDNAAYVQYRDLSNQIHIICDDLARFGAVGNDVRKEPLVIVLSGTPGVGKSIISQHILDDLACEILNKDQFSEYATCSGTFIYTPNQTEKFMSGYTNQPLVTLDDLGYSQDSIEIMVPRFISMVNSMPYSVEQAELHRKGNVYFDSKLILATSNIFNWAQAANKLTSTEALCRRLHVCIKVSCKPEYAKQLKVEGANCQLDPTKVENFDVGEWCDFKIYDPEGKVQDHTLCHHSLSCKCDTESCHPATFAELAKLCVQTYRERMSYMDKVADKRKAKLQRMLDNHGDTLSVIDIVHSKEQIETQGPCDEFCVFHNNARGTEDELISKVVERVQKGYVCNKHCCHNELTYEMYGKIIEDPEEKWLPFDLSKPICIREYRTAMPQLENCMLSTFEYLHMMKAFKEVNDKPGVFYHALRYCKHATHVAWKKIVDFTEGTFFEKFLKVLFSPVTIGIIAIMASVASAIGLYSYFKKTEESSKETLIKGDISDLVTQSIDNNALDVMRCLASSNVMHLFNNGTYLSTVFGIMNEVILINEHCYDKLKLCGGNIDLYRQGKTGRQWRFGCDVSFLISKDVYKFQGQDLIAVKVPGLLIRDVTHLLSDDVFTSANSKTFGIAWFNPFTNDHEYNCFIGPSKQPLNISEQRSFDAYDQDTGKTYTTTSWIKYDIPTIKGMCGAPIILMDASNKKKLVGIHCAGNNTDGFGVRITLRQIMEIKKQFKAYTVQSNLSIMSKENIFYDEYPEKAIDNCQVIGHVNHVSTVLKTEIVRSPLYDRIEGAKPNLIPAILTPKTVDGVLVCPIEKNLQGYARGIIVPNQEVLKGVIKTYINRLQKNTKPPRLVRFLSFEETVEGCPELPFVRSINRGTSGGYPDKLYLKDKKRSAFGYDEVFTFDSPEAVQQRETWEEAMLALENGPIEMVANIFPKDELRPKEKAKQLKTRLIAGFSCSATLVIRSVFGPMVDWFSCDENRIENYSAVGVNPSGVDWAKIALKLGYGSPDFDVKAGDYSSFDKTLNPYFMNSVFDIWMEFFGCRMTQRERTIADNCWKSILNVVVACKDNLVFWGNSNPSGNPLTTIINTISNVVILMYGITNIVARPTHFVEVVNLWNKIGDDIQFVCYGDDNMFSVNLQSKFLRDKNPISYENLGNSLNEIGFTYTDENKTNGWNETKRSIFEVSFLKRTFYKEKGNVLAPLDLNTILQKIQWKKRGDASNELFFLKFSTFIAELSVHPPEIYDKYHKIMFDALESSVPNHSISRSQTQTEWREHWSKVCESL